MLIRRHQLPDISGHGLEHTVSGAHTLNPADVILDHAVLVNQNRIRRHLRTIPKVLRQALHMAGHRLLRVLDFRLQSRFLTAGLRRLLFRVQLLQFLTGRDKITRLELRIGTGQLLRRGTRKRIRTIDQACMIQRLQNRLSPGPNPRVQRRVIDGLRRSLIKLNHPVTDRLIIKIISPKLLIRNAAGLHRGNQIGRIPIGRILAHVIGHIGGIESLAGGVRFKLTQHHIFQILGVLPDLFLLRALIDVALALIKQTIARGLRVVYIHSVHIRGIQTGQVFVLALQHRPIPLLNRGDNLIARKSGLIISQGLRVFHRLIFPNQPVYVQLGPKTHMSAVNRVPQILLRRLRRIEHIIRTLGVALTANHDRITSVPALVIQNGTVPGHPGPVSAGRHIRAIDQSAALPGRRLRVVEHHGRGAHKRYTVCRANRFTAGKLNQIHAVFHRGIRIIVHLTAGTAVGLNGDLAVCAESICNTGLIHTGRHHIGLIGVDGPDFQVITAAHGLCTACLCGNHVPNLTRTPVLFKRTHDTLLLQTTNHIIAPAECNRVGIPNLTIPGPHTGIDIALQLLIRLLIHQKAHQAGAGFIRNRHGRTEICPVHHTLVIQIDIRPVLLHAGLPLVEIDPARGKRSIQRRINPGRISLRQTLSLRTQIIHTGKHQTIAAVQRRLPIP